MCMLKHDLHFNLRVEDSPLCTCHHIVEDVRHYFMECHLYTVHRNVLLQEIITLNTEPSVLNLLFGNDNNNVDKNISLALSVQTFITETGRFLSI